MLCVLLAAAGAAWEATAMGVLAAHPELVVLKRCVDVDDLLATAASGQADVALVAIDAPGLDGAAVERLRRHQVRTVAVADARPATTDAAAARSARIGAAALVHDDALADLPALLTSLDALDDGPVGPDDELSDPWPEALGVGPQEARVITVWGPAGAPGRTMVAAAVAAELARRGDRTVLVDADPYGGAVAQQLGILDEVSGLLAAARLAATGSVSERLPSLVRAIGGRLLDGRLEVVTGLPRADRWSELRPGAVEALVEAARRRGHVVVDTGFSLESDPAAEMAGRPSRNGPTLAAIQAADEVLVVGTPDPVGLSRLARALVELRETVAPRAVRVVVNRHRASLGWSERDIVAMIEGFSRVAGVWFLPDDTAAVDRALVAGETLVESGESALSRAVATLVDAVVPTQQPPGRGRLRRRTAARAHRR
ncbi:MAG: hypothetical protein U0R78_02430 [Nocardioidaceae bacterium]